MKTILASIYIATTIFASLASASIEIPEALSAFLQEPAYQQILSQKKASAQKAGLYLHITRLDEIALLPSNYVYVVLATSQNPGSEHTKKNLGSIVGSVVYGPNGEVGFDGIFFKSAGELPGGASVGNK